MGKLVRVMKCLYHNDNKPSMAVYEEEDGSVWYHCFGCKAHGKFDKHEYQLMLVDGTDSVVTESKFPQAKLEEFGALTQTGKDFLLSRGIDIDLAVRYGIKQKNDRLWLPCYDFQQRLVGAQIRYLGKLKKGTGKYMTVRIAGIPEYSYIASDNPETGIVFIVESIFDGLCLQSNLWYDTVIACLGTKVSGRVYDWIAINDDRHYIIIPDSDAVVWGHVVRETLSNMGVDAMLIKLIGTNSLYEFTDWDNLREMIISNL